MTNDVYVGFICESINETFKERYKNIFKDNSKFHLLFLKKDGTSDYIEIVKDNLSGELRNIFNNKLLVSTLKCIELRYVDNNGENHLINSIDII